MTLYLIKGKSLCNSWRYCDTWQFRCLAKQYTCLFILLYYTTHARTDDTHTYVYSPPRRSELPPPLPSLSFLSLTPTIRLFLLSFSMHVDGAMRACCTLKSRPHYQSCVALWLNTHSLNSKLTVVRIIYLSGIIHSYSLTCYGPC